MQRAVFAAAACALAITPASFAASPSPKDVENFKFSVFYDLEQLSTQEGVAETYQKISSQVRRACRGSTPTRLTLEEHRQAKACTESSLDRAVDRINHAELTAYHSAMVEE